MMIKRFEKPLMSFKTICNIFTVVCLLVFNSTGNAQAKKPKVTFHMGGATTNTLYLQANPPASCTNPPNSQIRNSTLNAILDWKGDYKTAYLTTAYTVTLTIKAYNTFSGTSGLLATYIPTLSVSTASPQAYISIDITGAYININRFDVTAAFANTGGTALSDIEHLMTADVYYTEDFDYDAHNTAGTTLITLNPVTYTNNVANFSWSTNCLPAPNYQVQLLKLYNTAPTNTTTETVITTDVDWNKALSIETGNSLNQLSLTLAEGTGYYAWRVRPIGNAYTGGIANDLNWGLWSGSGAITQGASSVAVSSATSPYLFYYSQFDNNLNWIFTRNFVEGDATTAGQVNIGEAINYANGLQMARQQQVRIPSKQKTLVNQTLYDYCGRAALNTLSAPVDRNSLGYIPSYVKNTAGQSYSAADFDGTATFTAPAVMDSSIVAAGLSSPSQYYSSLNTNETDVPTAAGYPFTRTSFSKDGLNKPLEKSSPGYVHRINAANPRTARTLYSGIADIELVRLFGDEAPYENSVYKTINIDANNQSSINYTSKEGKTLATCLSTPTVSNLDPIPSSTLAAFTASSNVNNNNSPYGAYGYRSFKSVAFAELTTLSLGYTLTPNTYTDACNSFCATCDYKLTLKVTDNNDPDANPPRFTYTASIGSNSITCTSSTTVQNPTVSLPAGAYTVERIIEANNTSTASAVGNTYINDYVQKLSLSTYSTLSTGTATLVSDAGAVLLNGGGTTYTVSMSSVNGYLNAADLNGLYSYLGVVSTDTHKNIKIGCYTIKMPVWFCAARTCNTGDMGFERYLYSWYRAKNPTPTVTNQQILDLFINTGSTRTYSYSVNEIDTVINNMVNCGGYDCQKLWDCWQTTVASYGASSLQNTSYTSTVTATTYTYANDYLDMFLGCAGYNIQAITTTSWTGQGCSSFGYKSHPYAYMKYATACAACEQLFCQGTTTVVGTNCPSCVSTACSTFSVDFNAATTPTVATISGQNNAGTVTTSTTTVKNQFFNCYRHITNCNQGGTAPVNSSTNTIGSIVQNCKSMCNSRFNGFVSDVTDAYHFVNTQVQGDPYVLVTDPEFGGYSFGTATFTGTPGVSLATVYCEANQLLSSCLTSCSITVQPDNSLGSMAEIQTIANIMSGRYKVAIPTGTTCPMGYNQTISTTTVSAVNFYINVLNNQLQTIRNTAGSAGVYWDYRTFLISVDPAAASFCTSYSVFVHPDIPSYFTKVTDKVSCFNLMYVFNSNPSANSTIAPKPLYSTSSIASSTTFSYTSTGTVTAQSANTLTPVSYLFSSSFSPVITGTVSPVNFVLLQDALNSVGSLPVTNTTVINSYSNTVYPLVASWSQSICAGSSLCSPASTCSPICYTVSPMAAPNATDVVTYTLVTCAAQTTSDIRNSINNQVNVIIDSAAANLRRLYKLQCIQNLTDNYTMQYTLNYFHYTLYYYDRAGNLTKTVPPKGVESYTFTPLRSIHPAYNFITEYEYNSLGQLIRQKTPDGGETTFQYDAKGKLRFSQNAKQLPAGKNSYTKYDALARIIEVGEITATPSNTDLNTLSYPSSGGTDITQTVYSMSTAVTYSGNKPQRYLQNRVSYSLTDKDGYIPGTADQVKTCYSYDPHGNVEWLTQDIPELGRSYTGYDYDVISGSVVKVKYNEQFTDKFYHRYTYDTDKRLRTVETSKDNYFWEKDADYNYYLHGPLKRTLIGRDQIQGLDYAYTVHGWLKAMNGLNQVIDPGGDGGLGGDNVYVAKDAYGMLLDYYAGDYVNKTSFLNSASTNTFNLQGTSLYNGNISSWMQNYDNNVTSGMSGGIVFNGTAMGRTFKYDQLNRITAAQTYTYGTAVWATVNDYKESFAYDPNGNITKLFRNGNSTAGLAMDSFSYRYAATDNRLNSVHDLTTTTTAYSTDIDNQAAGNYTYDAIGNLTADLTGSLTAVTWNVYGKIASITKADGTVITYLYDASGNRVYKKVSPSGNPLTDVTTYYSKDASGNNMGVYDRTNTGTSPNFTATYTMKEEPIYGSERLGVRNDPIIHAIPYVSPGTPTPLVNSSVVHNSAYVSLLIPMINNTKTQLYIQTINTAAATSSVIVGGPSHVLNMSALTTNTAVTFKNTKAAAMAFDDAGNVLLSAWSYSTNNTSLVPPGLLLYIKDTLSVPLASEFKTTVNALAQCAFIKKPGTDDNYYMFTFGLDGKPYYHTIDASLAVMVDYNTPLDNIGTYGNTMAVLDDKVGLGSSMLYLKRYDNDSTYIQPFSITGDGITPLPKITVSASDVTYAGLGDIRLSAHDSLIAVATHLAGVGRIHMYKLGTDHQTFTATGKLLIDANGSYCKSIQFGPTDQYMFFTSDDNTSRAYLNRVAVSSFSAAPTLSASVSAQLLDSRTGTNIVSAIRRGVNNGLYYATNAAGTTTDLHLFPSPEALTLSTATLNIFVTLGGLTSAHLPQGPNILVLASPSPTTIVSSRVLDKKEYELKDHLGNVHMTVKDYKVPFTGTPDTRYDERFNDGSTGSASGSFTVTAGSPGGTAVTNPDTRLMVSGSSGSTVNNVIALSTGRKYLIGFDYAQGACSAASYSLTNLNIGGSLQADGHTELVADIGSATNINLQFSCNDALAARSFYIDNILIKDLGASIAVQTNTVVNETFTLTSYPWVASNSSITYVSGKMHITGTSGTAPYNVARATGLLQNQIYKVRLDVGTSPSLAGGTLSFGFDSNDNTPGQDFTQNIGSAAGTYTFYICPKTVESTFYINLNNPSGAFAFDIGNFIVELGQKAPAPLYTAVANNLTDYYAFGAPMPGRQYTNSGYRYGFNGKEKDNETYGSNNAYDFEARIYDPRLGRFLSIDPLAVKYPAYSPYNFVADNPILLVDKDGREIWISFQANLNNGKTITQSVQYKDGKLYSKDGKEYKGNNAYFKAVTKELNELKTDTKVSNEIITSLENSKNKHTILFDKPAEYEERIGENNMSSSDGKGGSVIDHDNPWAKQEASVSDGLVSEEPKTILIHELKHSYDAEKGQLNQDVTSKNGIEISEINAVKVENEVRKANKLPKRTTYAGVKIESKLLNKKGDVTKEDVK